MKERDYTSDAAKSTVRATVARALAHALISGIYQAEQEGHALTQVQQIDLATMSVMSYSEALEACEGIDLEARLFAAIR